MTSAPGCEREQCPTLDPNWPSSRDHRPIKLAKGQRPPLRQWLQRLLEAAKGPEETSHSVNSCTGQQQQDHKASGHTLAKDPAAWLED